MHTAFHGDSVLLRAPKDPERERVCWEVEAAGGRALEIMPLFEMVPAGSRDPDKADLKDKGTSVDRFCHWDVYAAWRIMLRSGRLGVFHKGLERGGEKRMVQDVQVDISIDESRWDVGGRREGSCLGYFTTWFVPLSFVSPLLHCVDLL